MPSASKRISTSRDIYFTADIVDQIPEAGEEEYSQIGLPTVKGNIIFDRVTFGFWKAGS